MRFTEILNKPYPAILNKWKITLSVSVFISIFLCVFQPFGLQFVQINNKTVVLAGYGLITFILLLLNLYLLPLLFKKSFREENWTVGKQILWLICIVLSISVGNYGYSIYFLIFPWLGIKGILVFIAFTFPIALIPITAITFAAQHIYLKRNLALSEQINNTIDKEPRTGTANDSIITLHSGNQKHQFVSERIVLLESEGNYVNIYFLENGLIKTELVRNTLKNIDLNISTEILFKCHRAFVINTSYIEKVKGNSQGLSLTVRYIDKQIPVSRNNIKSFKELITNTDK